MTIAARNGVHFLDEKAISNLTRIMFSHRSSLNSNSTKDAPKGACGLLHSNYLWEVMILWELLLPLLALLIVLGSRSAPVSGLCWLFSVLHANLSVWVWISYFVFSYNYCWEEIVSLKCPDCSTVACTGGIFLGISLVISIIAAIANDQYYPDARMTTREAKSFFAHIKRSHPELTLTLRSHLNSMGDWLKVKKVYIPRAWQDETIYPDVGEVISARQSVVFKITMAVYAKSVEAKDDLRSFVWDFGQEYNQTITLEDIEDYMMTAALHPAQGQTALGSRRGVTGNRVSIAQRYGRYQGTGIPRKQPTLTAEKTLRIYVRKDGNLPVLLDCLMRFAWILNLTGWSGIVLHCLTKLHTMTERVHIEKRYGPRRETTSPVEDRDGAVQIRDNNHTPPPPYSSMSYTSPPPRYMSVIQGLNHQQPPKKATKATSKSSRQTQSGSSAAPKMAPNSNCAEEEEGDLPTYDQATSLEHQDSIATVCEGGSNSVMRVSMV